MIKKILLLLFKVSLTAIITLLFVNFFLQWLVTGSAIRPAHIHSESDSIQKSKELRVFYSDKLNIEMEGEFFEEYGDKFEIWLDNFEENDKLDYGMFFWYKKPLLGEKILQIRLDFDAKDYSEEFGGIFSNSGIYYACCGARMIYWFNETVELKVYSHKEKKIVGTLKISRW